MNYSKLLYLLKLQDGLMGLLSQMRRDYGKNQNILLKKRIDDVKHDLQEIGTIIQFMEIEAVKEIKNEHSIDFKYMKTDDK